jgi:hypothetical protein
MFFHRTSPLDPFLKAMQWIGQSQDPFTNFYTVFQPEDRVDDAETSELSQYMLVSYSEDQVDKYWPRVDKEKHVELKQIFNMTSLAIPSFKTRMEEFTDSPEHLEDLCSQVHNLL